MRLAHLLPIFNATTTSFNNIYNILRYLYGITHVITQKKNEAIKQCGFKRRNIGGQRLGTRVRYCRTLNNISNILRYLHGITHLITETTP